MSQPSQANRPRIFISHAPEDGAWCRAFVEVLRQADADVWYEEPRDVSSPDESPQPRQEPSREEQLAQGPQHSQTSAPLTVEVRRELAARPTFIIVLSPAAIACARVRGQVRAANYLWHRTHSPLILPVMAETCEAPRLWATYRCICGEDETGSETGLPPEEAARRVAALRDIIDESAAHAHARGLALFDQRKNAEALAAFARASILDPTVPRYWNCRGLALRRLGRHVEALAALKQALALDPTYAAAWYNLGLVWYSQRPREDALRQGLVAFDRALELDPLDADAWHMKATVLVELGRLKEAEEARKRWRAALPRH
jgi:tetratricopeptide (TPR) repeat protein